MEYFWIFIALAICFIIIKSALAKRAKRRAEDPKLQIARKMHRVDFGTYPDVSAKFEDTKIETTVGTFLCYHDGTFSDLTNNLMWIQAPWGTEWNGKKFKGTPIKLSWYDAVNLFGYAGRQPKAAALKKEDIDIHGFHKYAPGSCIVTFSGYNDWRLPTAKELLTLTFCDDKDSRDHAGHLFYSSAKAQELREQLFPDFPDLRKIWCANDNGIYGWASDQSCSLGDYEKSDECVILFVRKR